MENKNCLYSKKNKREGKSHELSKQKLIFNLLDYYLHSNPVWLNRTKYVIVDCKSNL